MALIHILNACAVAQDLRARSGLLRGAGFTVTEAAGSDDLVALAEREPPDVIILDIAPGADPAELCRRLKQKRATKAARIVRVARAPLDPDFHAACLETGADLFLVAPFEPRVLLAQVRALARSITAEQAERRFLRLVIDSVVSLITVRDHEGCFILVNEAAARFHGKTVQDLVGTKASDLATVPPEMLAEDKDVLRTGTARRTETRAVAADGTIHSLVTFRVPLANAEGTIDRVLIASQDVTERSRAQAALRATEQRLRSHVENSPVAVIEWDKDFVVTMWSGEAERMFGWTAAETIGTPLTGLAMVFEADVPVVESVMGQLTDGQTRQVVSSNRNYTKDGRVIHSTWYNSVLLDDQGRMASVLSLVLDNTERERAVAALRHANAQLEESDRSKDEFIAVLSHELRNPLAPIRYALPVLDDDPSGEEARRARAVIGRQADHLTRLVDDLLDVSRITRGQIELRREDVTIAAVVAAAVEAASPSLSAERHTLEVAVPDEPIWVHADPARLSQVLTNLLNNSAKFTPRGGAITIEAWPDGDEAFVRVRDNGIGIPADALPKVFDMFRRIDQPARTQGGLGIGLGLVKRLIEMHGGRVDARSDGTGHGAEFTVRLPKTAAPVDHQAWTPNASAAQTASSAGPATGRKLKVLVVDDNADLLEMLGLVVESAGHDVRKAMDGKTAVAAALSYQPDVVLLDLGLPGMSGIDVARELKGHAETAGSLLVALTGWGQVEDRRQTKEAGFDHHLTKPTDPGQLEKLLTEYARSCVRA